MKNIFTLAALMLLAFTGFAQDGKSIYNKYSEAEGVSAVYISPAMFRLIGKIPNIQVENSDVNLTPIIQALNGMYLISSKNPRINAEIKADANRFLEKNQYELLMEAKDGGETVRICTLGKDIITGFVLLAFQQNEFTFISLDGKMKREDLERLIAESR
ncbi:MAG: DUF4252 domain-containing protein [Candidatus Cryptobacteroides sp.]|jgi:hypothetical protein